MEQAGGGEDERGWAVQGKTDNILDNLIAEGKAKPMLVVIPNGNVSKPGVAAGFQLLAITFWTLFHHILYYP